MMVTCFRHLQIFRIHHLDEGQAFCLNTSQYQTSSSCHGLLSADSLDALSGHTYPKERFYASHLHDTFTAIHYSKLIHTHQLFAKFLIIHVVRLLRTLSISCGVHINSFLAKNLGEILKRCLLNSTKEDLRIYVADNGIRIIFVDCLKL